MIGSGRFWLVLVSALALPTVTVAVPEVTRPGGVYRLKPGIFVQKGVSCASAPNAAILRYDGMGLSDAHSHACQARIVSRKGNRLFSVQSCIDAGAGAAPRVSRRQVVTVQDALTFSLSRAGEVTSYRYCAPSMLGEGIR